LYQGTFAPQNFPGTRLYQWARMFEKWQVLGFEVVYTPAISTNNNGEVAMFVEADVADLQLAGLSEIYKAFSAGMGKRFNVFVPASVHYKPEGKQPDLWTSSGTDNRLTQAIQMVVVAMANVGTGSTIGTLSMRYKLKFYMPIIESDNFVTSQFQAAVTQAGISRSVLYSATGWATSTPNVNTNFSISITGAINFNVPGQYLIGVDYGNCTLTANSLVAGLVSGGATALQEPIGQSMANANPTFTTLYEVLVTSVPATYQPLWNASATILTGLNALCWICPVPTTFKLSKEEKFIDQRIDKKTADLEAQLAKMELMQAKFEEYLLAKGPSYEGWTTIPSQVQEEKRDIDHRINFREPTEDLTTSELLGSVAVQKFLQRTKSPSRTP